MERWTCPDCQRQFGKPNQSHTCSPGFTIDDYFATAKPWERAIFDRVADHLEGLGDVIVDPISIGILFKNGPVFCQLRAMKRWTALGFSLDRRLTSARISRKVVEYHGKYFHVVNVDDPAQIDDEVLGWLTEAYRLYGGGSDPMVPDDVDDPFA